MSNHSPVELREALGSGLLSFPVTHAAEDLTLDVAGYREHLEYLAAFGASGLFAAGGTGEFFSLTPGEVDTVVRTAVDAVAGTVPVVAPAGYGTSIAVEMAKSGEAAGADGIFVLPPYLTEMPQDGIYEHVAAVCRATKLGVIVYHRANAAYTAETVRRLAEGFPNFIGFKDGVGEVELLANLSATLGDRLLYLGGLPTAETFALPYLELGVTTYSSAIFNFAPAWALEFYRAVRRHDRPAIAQATRDFLVPYLAIRNRRQGYGVSIVKAGMTAAGRPAGAVRPPLSDLTSDEFEALSVLVKQVI